MRTRRTAMLGTGLAALLAGAGCSSLQYKDTDQLWEESEDHFSSGRYESALPYYDELLRRDENDTRARMRRGVAQERVGETADALADYGTVGGQGDVSGYLYSTNLHIRRGDFGQAEDDLRRLRDMNLSKRDRVIQLTLLGTLRLRQGQYRRAAQSLERAVADGGSFQDPAIRRTRRDAHYNASFAYYNLGDFRRAYDHLVDYATGSRGSRSDLLQGQASIGPDDYYQLGLLAYLAGDFEASRAHLSRADPDKVAQAAKILDDPSFGAGARREHPE